MNQVTSTIKRSLIWQFAILFLFVFSLSIFSQQKNDNSIEIIEKYVNARGGLANYDAVNSWKVSGVFSNLILKQNLPITIYIQKPSFFRFESEINGQKAIQGFDGKTAWTTDPKNPKSFITVPSFDPAQLKEQMELIEGPLLRYKAKNLSFKLIGKEKVNGTECSKIQVLKTGDKEERYIFISTKDYLLYKISGKIDAMGKKVQMDTYFKNYTKFNNLVIAKGLETIADGTLLNRMELQNISLNQKFDSKIFKKPGK